MNNKEELYKELTKEQIEFVEFLLDSAYSNGYNSGRIDEKITESY